MNILYLSRRNPNKHTGPYYSIRNQVFFQNKQNNCFWYNLTKTEDEFWRNSMVYNNLADFPKSKIKYLPTPFNKPDLIIIEGLYDFGLGKIFKEIWKNKFQYIIVPRSGLTYEAQKQSIFKKRIANFFIYNKLLKKAKYIHFLTEQEKKDSIVANKYKNFVIPNGIIKQTLNLTTISRNNDSKIKGLFIGRFDINQKGIDLLFASLSELKDDFVKANVFIELYGINVNNSKSQMIDMMEKFQLDTILSINDPIFDVAKEKKFLSSDFFVLTSRFEGHPMGLLEALSYGLPCIASRGSNMYNEIEQFNAGWCCENNREAITLVLKKFLNELHFLKKKSQNALSLAEKYSWNSISILENEIYSS